MTRSQLPHLTPAARKKAATWREERERLRLLVAQQEAQIRTVTAAAQDAMGRASVADKQLTAPCPACGGLGRLTPLAERALRFYVVGVPEAWQEGDWSG